MLGLEWLASDTQELSYKECVSVCGYVPSSQAPNGTVL
jgi:hypothetical protein